METKTSARRWWALASVAAAQFLAVADAFIVNVAIPSIRADLHAGAAEIQAVIAVYQIAYAALVITGGRLGDIFGRKRIFITGILGFTLASLWCGLSGSAPMLIFARAAQGGAAAMMVPQVLATIHTLFPDGARARAFTIFARRHRPWRRLRLHARRLAGDAEPRRPRLAQHLLRQCADRHRHRARRRKAHAGDAPQRRHAARSARRRCAVRRTARPDRAADVRARARLAVVAVARDGGRRHGAGRLRATAAPDRAAWRHAADRPGTARGPRLHRRHVRDVLLLPRQPVVLLRADALHPERPGLLAVRRGADGDAAGICVRRRLTR